MKATLKWAGGLGLALLVCGAPSTASALGFGIVITGGGGGHHHQGRNAYRLGYERGYQDGFEHGRRDSHRHDDYDFRDAREYRRGDRGYDRGCGPRFEYVAGYRGGYEEGYRRAFHARGWHRHHHGGRDGWCYERHTRCHDCDYDRDGRLNERESGRDDRWRGEQRCDPRRERCDDQRREDRDDDWERR